MGSRDTEAILRLWAEARLQVMLSRFIGGIMCGVGCQNDVLYQLFGHNGTSVLGCHIGSSAL